MWIYYSGTDMYSYLVNSGAPFLKDGFQNFDRRKSDIRFNVKDHDHFPRFVLGFCCVPYNELDLYLF